MPRATPALGAMRAVATAIDAGCTTLPKMREYTALSTNQCVHALSVLCERSWAKSLNPKRGNKYQPAHYVLLVPLSVCLADEGVGMDATALLEAMPMPVQFPPIGAGEVRKVSMGVFE